MIMSQLSASLSRLTDKDVLVQGFWVPVCRHLWWWIGGRSADKHTMHHLLTQGHTVVLIPGGVQECTYLQSGRETIFLRSRKSFVRIAMQHGAHLHPDCVGLNVR